MANFSSINFSMVYKSRQIICAVLKERGYNVSEYENHSINDVHLLDKTDQLDMIVSRENGKKVYIKYLVDKSLRDNHVKEVIQTVIEEDKVIQNTDDIIIINKSPPNDTIKKTLNKLFFNRGIFVTIICIKNLQFNLLEHSSVPKHEIVESNEELDALFKRFNIKRNSEFPQISRYDPVAIYIGLKPNDVCKITRKSKSSINSEYYRVCVPN